MIYGATGEPIHPFAQVFFYDPDIEFRELIGLSFKVVPESLVRYQLLPHFTEEAYASITF